MARASQDLASESQAGMVQEHLGECNKEVPTNEGEGVLPDKQEF